MKNSVESVENAAEKKERRNIKVMDLILVIVGVSLLVFTIVMIQLFKVYGTVPDTLITCVFATLGGECGTPLQRSCRACRKRANARCRR